MGVMVSKRYEWDGGIVEIEGDIVELLTRMADAMLENGMEAQGALTMAAALEVGELRGAGAVWH